MRIKQMIIHKLYMTIKMKNKPLPTCFNVQGNYRASLGEFSNTSCDVFRTERDNDSLVKRFFCDILHCHKNWYPAFIVQFQVKLQSASPQPQTPTEENDDIESAIDDLQVNTQ